MASQLIKMTIAGYRWAAGPFLCRQFHDGGKDYPLQLKTGLMIDAEKTQTAVSRDKRKLVKQVNPISDQHSQGYVIWSRSNIGDSNHMVESVFMVGLMEKV